MTLLQRTLRTPYGDRTYLLATPPADRSPLGVVLSLHGSLSNAAQQAALSGMARLTGAGAVVAFPQAARPARRGFVWDPAGDPEFILALAASLNDEFAPVERRVCLSGMSGGARMSCQVAWDHPERVWVVGAVAGVRCGAPPLPVRPVPVLAFHGTSDRINPYPGGHDARWDMSVPDAVAGWARANGVVDGPTVTAVSPTLTRWTFGVEGAAGEVTLWTSQGAGHTWPGGHLRPAARLFLGRTSREVDATDAIWSFALAHRSAG